MCGREDMVQRCGVVRVVRSGTLPTEKFARQNKEFDPICRTRTNQTILLQVQAATDSRLTPVEKSHSRTAGVVFSGLLRSKAADHKGKAISSLQSQFKSQIPFDIVRKDTFSLA